MRRYAAGLVEKGLFDTEEAVIEAASVFASFDGGGSPARGGSPEATKMYSTGAKDYAIWRTG